MSLCSRCIPFPPIIPPSISTSKSEHFLYREAQDEPEVDLITSEHDITEFVYSSNMLFAFFCFFLFVRENACMQKEIRFVRACVSVCGCALMFDEKKALLRHC